MTRFSSSGAWACGRRKALPSIAIVAMLVMVSGAAVIVSSGGLHSRQLDASLESVSTGLIIMNVSCDPDEALVDEPVVWTVAVDLQDQGQRGKGLLFTWDWDDGTYTVYHLNSVNNSDTAIDVQTHAWSEAGTYEVMVSVWDGYGNENNKWHNVSETVQYVVNEGAQDRTVDYRWHDMFAHELGPWYEERAAYYGDECVLTDEYPYLYTWEKAPLGNVQIRSFMRMEALATNLSEINMNDNPEFLPQFGASTGGRAFIDWHMDYVTRDEAEERLSDGAMAWYDGWFIALNGTVVLDREGAKSVLGLSDSEYDDFDSWWASNGDSVQLMWRDWLDYEASNERLATYNMYEYDLTFLYFDIEASTFYGDQVMIELETISWGMEALMTRWLHEAFMPTEWYMEDMDLYANIFPDSAEIYFDAAVGYALTASESLVDGTPCWTWQAMLQDYRESTLEYPISDFDPYADQYYYLRYPGNEWYHEMMPYDFTPGSWNLSAGETLTFEWPADEVLFFINDANDSGTGILDGALDFWSTMTVDYSEPMPSDSPDKVVVDQDERWMRFTGPFDMWSWSRDQTAHSYLADEWDRLGMLPYGVPYIEFRAVEGLMYPPVADFAVYPEEGTLDTVFLFNASSSHDVETPWYWLQVRWDWESDGVWDTPYSLEKVVEHQFSSVGTYIVTMEVMDTDGMVGQTSREVSVLESPVPSPHDPILIDGDRDFLPENGVIGGSGTIDDPYVIGGWIIHPTEGNGITVLNTKKFLTISDCRIIGGNAYVCMAGVYLEDVENAVLDNLSIGGFMMGVRARSTVDLTVISCELSWNSWGVSTFLCGSVVVSDNEISHSVIGPGNRMGIDVSDSESVIIVMNNLWDNSQGIRVYAASEAVVWGNTIEYNTSAGVQFAYSSGVISGNSITSKIDGILVYGCTDTVVEWNEVTHDYSSSASLFGIEFTSCSNLRISDNVVDSYLYGIGTHYSSQPPTDSEGVTVTRNRISDCGGSGMRVHYVSGLTVTTNVFLHNGIGMDVDSSASLLQVYHNDFVDNSIQVFEDALCVGNQWDDGYPSGGNYWDDYVGVDYFNGPDQDVNGSDGIGDTPYQLLIDNLDRYPLMEPVVYVPVNQPPVANFTVYPQSGTVATIFEFDASSSWDWEDPTEALVVRWDWESNGVWDTSWTTVKVANHRYLLPGVYEAALEVRDSDGLSDVTFRQVIVDEYPGLIPHDPIYIYSDSMFTAENGVVSGDGTAANPYVIEGWDIDASMFTYGLGGVAISQTSSYFIVRNLYVHDGKAVSVTKNGIHLYDNEHAVSVKDCKVESNDVGILASKCPLLCVSGNNISFNEVGSLLIESQGSLFMDNVVAFSDDYGVIVGDATGITVVHNYILDSGTAGMSISESDGCAIESNLVVNNLYNINVNRCTNIVVWNNTIPSWNSAVLETGIRVLSSSSCTLTGNVISTRHHCIAIYDSDTIKVSYNDITGPSTDGYACIGMWNCSDMSVNRNSVANNLWGIWMAGVSDSLVEKNIVVDNRYGIGLDSHPDSIYSSRVVVKDNEVFGNEEYGIYLLFWCQGCSLIDNYLFDNHDIGIAVTYSQDTLVQGNEVSCSGGTGLLVRGVSCARTIVTDNDFVENAGAGVELDSCVDTSVHHNRFVLNSVQAMEDLEGSGNVWDDGYPSGGNFWSDYSGADLFSGSSQDIPGSDGIGDTPYLIDSVHSDRYPLMEASSGEPSLTYRVYDMFGEPWGEWWDKRSYGTWDRDRLLTETAGDVTMLNSVWGVPTASSDDQGVIYAPYRYNVAGTNLPNIDVHTPTFMPVLGSGPNPGAEASLDIIFQYSYQDWWDAYWIPEWSDHPDWDDWDELNEFDDGWFVYTVYTIDMNHEAAEEWLGMGAADDPDDWWAINEDAYVLTWDSWIMDQGNEVYDIFCGYDWPYTILSTTMMRLTGDMNAVHMEIAHVNWGYEALMTRWLSATQISVHQAYMEDFSMSLDLGDGDFDIDMDAVCQYSMHCVKQESATPEDGALCAWVWEPIGLDFIPSLSRHPSTYDPYDPDIGEVTYQSWNCGDPNYDTEIGYEVTPWAMSLPSYATLVFELPQSTDTIGYYAEPVPENAMELVWEYDDYSVYDALRYQGDMTLGHMELGGCSAWDYDPVSKVLTINGPWDFTYPHPDNSSLLYHGAPWIEFDVMPLSGNESISADGSASGTVVTTASGLAGLSFMTLVVSAVVLTTMMLSGCLGRRREC